MQGIVGLPVQGFLCSLDPNSLYQVAHTIVHCSLRVSFVQFNSVAQTECLSICCVETSKATQYTSNVIRL
jgi:hypothetical protein